MGGPNNKPAHQTPEGNGSGLSDNVTTSSSISAGHSPSGTVMGGTGAPVNVCSTKEPAVGTNVHVAPTQAQVVPSSVMAYSK